MPPLNELAVTIRRALAADLDPEAEPRRDLKRMKTVALGRFSLARLEPLQRLDELVTRLHLHHRDTEVLAVGRQLLAYPFDGNFTRFGPVESILALTARIADRHGDVQLSAACRDNIIAAYGRPDEWSDQRRDAMRRRLGGWQVEWQERNRPNDDKGYTSAQLGELAFLALWGGSEAWPLERIDHEFEEKTAYLRRLFKL